MEISTELEEQVTGHLSRRAGGRIFVATASELIDLANPRSGSDFIYGASAGALVVIPLSAIKSLSGATPPEPQQISISEFLASQRTPVRIRYRLSGEVSSCWLLNVMPPWLRISSVSGIAWLPLSAVEYARIETGLSLASNNEGEGK